MISMSDHTVSSPLRLRHRLLRAGLWVTMGFVLDKVLAAGQLMLVARLLTPVDFGLMAMVSAIMVTLLTVSELGLEQALVTKQSCSPEDLAVAWTLGLCRGAILMVAVWICASPLARFFQAVELESLLRVFAVSLLIQSLRSPALALLTKNLEHKRRVQVDLLRRVVEVSSTIGLALWWPSVWALVGGQLAGFLMGALMSYIMAPFTPQFSLAQPSRSYLMQYGRYVNRATWFIFGVTCGGEVVIGRMLGMEALGLYQMAMVLPLLVGTRIPLLMNQVTLPTYVMLEHERSPVVRGFLLQILSVAPILGAISVTMACAAPYLIDVIGGPSWSAAAAPLTVLSVYSFCCGLSTLMGALHYGLNRPDVQIKVGLVQFVVYAATLIPFTTVDGIVGAAWALSLAYAVGVVVHLYYTRTVLLRNGETVVDLFREEVPHLRGLLRGL